MQFVLAIIGLLFGGWLASEVSGLFGALAGAAILFLLAAHRQQLDRINALKALTDNLETALRTMQESQREMRRALESLIAPGAEVRPETEAEDEPELAPEAVVEPEPRPPAPEPVVEAINDIAESGRDPYDSAPPVPEPAQVAAKAMPREAVRRSSEVSDPIEDLFSKGKNWLTTGNVPVKLGVIVLFFGVSFLLKYAVDNRIFNIPIEIRYLFIAAAAASLLVVGWRLREKNPVYALSLQGGGIGVLYLTIFAAYRLHDVLPAPMAFLLMVALTIGTGVLAVRQDARAIAILGVVGGFLTPILVSTGSGNHVALFSYYLILNAAILGIAWTRAWRSLNIIGWVFTFGVGTLWGNDSYTPEKFWSTEPFLVAHFVFYTVIAVLFALRQPPKLRGFVDGTLIFGTPAIAFALQALLVSDTEYGLAISALVTAGFYGLLASWLYFRRDEQMRTLVESFTALGVAFATVAIPLALDDRWTAVSWALEGTALVWIAVRQHRLVPRFAGFALLILAGIMFIDYGWSYDRGIAVFNGNLLGGLLISITSLFSSRMLATDPKPLPLQAVASVSLLVWGACWWLGSGTWEIFDRVDGDDQLHWLSIYYAASFAGLAFWGQLRSWLVANRAAFAYLLVLPVFALGYLIEFDHFFAEWGALAWVLAAAAHLYILKLSPDKRVAGFWHFAGGLLFALMLGYEAYYLADEAGYGETWRVSATLAMFLAIAAGIERALHRIDWPFRAHSAAYSLLAVSVMVLYGGLLFLAVLDASGDPDPMAYLPLLNPYDILTFVGLFVGWLFVRDADDQLPNLAQAIKTSWFGAAFFFSTIAVIRMVFHMSTMVWDWGYLLDSTSVQTALSIYWSVLGIGGMIYGNRHARRQVWMAGITLMVIVVAKLFLIDLGNTGTVARIVSFLGVGAMLLVVGYFAPAPPREEKA